MSGGTGGAGAEVGISQETMMRYLDGELAPEERRAFEARLESSTELQRELALFRDLHEDLSGIRLKGNGPHRSIWGAVHRRLTRPVGWILIVAGVLAWLTHASYVFVTAPTPTWEKLATSAVVIGVLLLFASVIHERWRELATDPYRDVER